MKAPKQLRLNESMRAALIAMIRRGALPVPFGNNPMYEPAMHPSTAYALERRGLGVIDPARPGRFNWVGGEIRFTDDGRRLAEQLWGEAQDRERQRLASLDLSPPKRGHLRLVTDR